MGVAVALIVSVWLPAAPFETQGIFLAVRGVLAFDPRALAVTQDSFKPIAGGDRVGAGEREIGVEIELQILSAVGPVVEDVDVVAEPIRRQSDRAVDRRGCPPGPYVHVLDA